MFGTEAAILSHVHVEEKKEKLIFQGEQENEEEMGKKKQITKYQVDPENSMASIPDLSIPVP